MKPGRRTPPRPSITRAAPRVDDVLEYRPARLVRLDESIGGLQELRIGARDPLGIRPLVLGRLGDAWVLASVLPWALPALPVDSTDPVEPIESTDPVEAIDRSEPSDRHDRREERPLKDADECAVYRAKPTATWINVDGVHDPAAMERIVGMDDG